MSFNPPPLQNTAANVGYGGIDTSLPANQFAGFQQGAQKLEQFAISNQTHQTQMEHLALAQTELDQQIVNKQNTQQSAKIFSEFQLQDQQRQNALQLSYTGDPTKYATTQMQGSRDLFNSTMQKIPTPYMTQGILQPLQKQFNDYQVSTQPQVLNQQTALTINHGIQTIEDTSRNLINSTTMDPSKYWENKAALARLGETMAGVIPENALVKMMQGLYDKNTEGMIQAKALVNPQQTLLELKNGVYNSLLTSDNAQQSLVLLTRQVAEQAKQKEAKALVDYKDLLPDHVASLMNTGVPVIPRSQVIALNNPRALSDYDAETRYSKQAHLILKGHEGLPATQQLGLLEAVKPKPGSQNYNTELESYNYIKQAITQNQTAFNADPVLASINSNAQVKAAFALSETDGIKSTLQYQLNKHIPLNQMKVFSQEQADKHAGQIKQLLDAGQTQAAYDLVNGLKSQYTNTMTLPDGRNVWDIAKNQIFNSTVSPIDKEFGLAMNYSRATNGIDVFNATKKGLSGKDSYSEILDKKVVKAVQSDIMSKMSAYSQVVQATPGFSGQDQLGNQQQLATKLALMYMTTGMSQNDATTKAYNTMFPVSVINTNNKKIRMPQSIGNVQMNPARVSEVLDSLQNVDVLNGFIKQGQASAANYTSGQVKMPNTHSPYLQVAIAAAQKHGLDPVLFTRQIYQESGFNPTASNKVIGMGGIAQIYTKYHPEMEGKTGDPYKSLDYAANLMANYVNTYKSMGFNQDKAHSLALSAYNAGASSVNKAGFQVPNIKETQNYVNSIMGVHHLGDNVIHNELETRDYVNRAKSTGRWVSSGDGTQVTLYSQNQNGSYSPVFNNNNELYQFKLVDLQQGNVQAMLKGATPPVATAPDHVPSEFWKTRPQPSLARTAGDVVNTVNRASNIFQTLIGGE